MATNTPITDTQRDSGHDGWRLVIGFFVIVLGSFIALVIGLIPQDARLFLLGLLFIGLPLLLGLVNAVLKHTYSSSIAIGVCPLTAWVLVTIVRVLTGDIPLNSVMFTLFAVGFTITGVLAATGGFAVGYIGRVAAAKYAGTGS